MAVRGVKRFNNQPIDYNFRVVKSSCDMKAAIASAKKEASEFIEATGATIKIDVLLIGNQYEGCDMDALRREMKRHW